MRDYWQVAPSFCTDSTRSVGPVPAVGLMISPDSSTCLPTNAARNVSIAAQADDGVDRNQDPANPDGTVTGRRGWLLPDVWLAYVAAAIRSSLAAATRESPAAASRRRRQRSAFRQRLHVLQPPSEHRDPLRLVR